MKVFEISSLSEIKGNSWKKLILLPEDGSISRRMQRPKVVFPDPDSPSKQIFSPFLISKFKSLNMFNPLF